MNQEELNNFLIDSRKSFRNLYIYIDRIKDIIKEIDSMLEGHSYTGGYPQFSNNIARSNLANLENWAWDWLPMYNYEFYFHVNVETKIKFSITIIVDTGFYDSPIKDKTDLDSFKPTEVSKSKIIFCIGKDLWFPDLKKNEKKEFDAIFTKDKDEFEKCTDKLKYMYGHAYDLNSFLTKEDIRTNLEDFIKKCTDKKIDTIVIKKEIQ